MVAPKGTGGLDALWLWDLPKLIANDKAMFAGIILGFIASKRHNKWTLRIAQKLEGYIKIIFESFIYRIAMFIIGFVVKLQSDGIINVIIEDYAVIFLVVACA